MALKAAIQTGNWSTAATWSTTTNTPTMHASTNLTMTTGVALYSAVFTAPNTTNTVTGVIIQTATIGTAGTLTLTLQEYSGAAWADASPACSAAIDISTVTLGISSFWLFKAGTPYQFTTTTAGYYRWKAVWTSSAGSMTLAADSGGSNFSYLSLDNRTGEPADTDDVFICSNGTTKITVTVDGAHLCGSGASTTVTTANKHALTNGLTISGAGELAFDITQDSTLTAKGNVMVMPYGYFTMDASTAATKTFRLRFDPTSTCDFGLYFDNACHHTLKGAAKTYYKTTYSSGTGTVADPLILADAVAWVVGDEIAIAATSDNATNYNENEYRFIITVNSPTSYVVSNTLGGAANALTNTHTTDAVVLNLTRNVVIDTDDTAKAWYGHNYNTVAGNSTTSWFRWDNLSAQVTNKTNFFWGNGATSVGPMDHGVINNSMYSGLAFAYSTAVETYSDMISVRSGTASSAGITCGGTNKTFNDFYGLSGYRSTISFGGAKNCTFNRFYIVGGNYANSTSYGGIYQTATQPGCVYNDFQAHCCGKCGFFFSQSGDTGTFYRPIFGTKGVNRAGFGVATGQAPISVIDSATIDTSDLPVYNYTAGADGTVIAFHELQDTTNNHIWYTNYGSAQSTGATLADTTTRTTGALAVRLTPESASPGFTYSYQILARANSAVQATGFVLKNATFGTSDLIVELYLPGSVTADATQTMPNDTNWNVFGLTANYTGAIPALATIKITAKSATAGAYAYVADLFNGTNVLTNLTTWDKGRPTPIMYEQLGDAGAVWGVLTSTATIAGSFGKLVNNKIKAIYNEII